MYTHFELQVGPHICVLKTHVDLLDTFDDDFVRQLQALADKHGAVLSPGQAHQRDPYMHCSERGSARCADQHSFSGVLPAAVGLSHCMRRPGSENP